MNSNIMRGVLAVVIVAAVLGLGIYIGRRGPAEQAAQAPAAAEQQPQAKKPATEKAAKPPKPSHHTPSHHAEPERALPRLPPPPPADDAP